MGYLDRGEHEAVTALILSLGKLLDEEIVL